MLPRKGAIIAIAVGLQCLCLHQRAEAATIYDTTPAWASGSVGPFNSVSYSTFGQTFVAPTADATLESFSFVLNASGHLEFNAYVFEWSGPLTGWGGQASGTALYSSPASIVIDGGGSYQPVIVNAGGVNLTAGGHYVAFFTTSSPANLSPSATSLVPANGQATFGLTAADAANDGGGGFVFARNGSNFDALTSVRWNTMADFGNLAWTATFGQPIAPSVIDVPEPATATLFAIACAGAAGYRIRRRRLS